MYIIPAYPLVGYFNTPTSTPMGVSAAMLVVHDTKEENKTDASK